MMERESKEALAARGVEARAGFSSTSFSTASSTSSQAIVASQQVQETGNNVNQMLQSAEPYVQSIIASGSSFAGQKISEIAGVIWDEFEQMSPLQKFLTIVAAAVIVGGVGYLAWNQIRGNWDKITSFAESQLKQLEERKGQLLPMISSHPIVKAIGAAFENKQQKPKITKGDVKKLFTFLCEAKMQALVPVFIRMLQQGSALQK